MSAPVFIGASSLLGALPGYPFFPCQICVREGFSGKDNDGCDHTVFERARAMHPTLVARPTPKQETDHE